MSATTVAGRSRRRTSVAGASRHAFVKLLTIDILLRLVSAGVGRDRRALSRAQAGRGLGGFALEVADLRPHGRYPRWAHGDVGLTASDHLPGISHRKMRWARRGVILGAQGPGSEKSHP